MKRLTTKQLKNRMDGLTFALALGVCGGQSQSEKWSNLAKKLEDVETEFYSRRNHKQYL